MLSHMNGWAMDWTKYTRNMVVCRQSQQMNNEASLANMQDRLSFPLLKDPADVVSLASFPPYSFQLLYAFLITDHAYVSVSIVRNREICKKRWCRTMMFRMLRRRQHDC